MLTMPDEREIFDTARRMGDAAARAAYLAEACGGEKGKAAVRPSARPGR